MDDKGQPSRPTLGAEGPEAREAIDAVAHLVKEVQAGWDQHNADISNRHFASDVMWGSPFGATVHGYKEPHAIHVRLKEQRRGGPSSRFGIVRVLVPAPGVAVAQVRRTALDPEGQPLKPSDDLTRSFSEMALYVLVRRGRVWWLAAGQNTPIRSAATAKR
jgi:uncharacterized protein (TIGR02246 family)